MSILLSLRFFGTNNGLVAISTKTYDYFYFPKYAQTGRIELVLDLSGRVEYGDIDSDNGGYIYLTLAANNFGGFIAGGFYYYYYKWNNISNVGMVAKGFWLQEFGKQLKVNNIDTALCYGQTAWGKTFYRDTAFADTARNECHVDTVINRYRATIVSMEDTTIVNDVFVCYGELYNGKPCYQSFVRSDTVFTTLACGVKKNHHPNTGQRSSGHQS